jgi:hypothetical protein
MIFSSGTSGGCHLLQYHITSWPYSASELYRALQYYLLTKEIRVLNPKRSINIHLQRLLNLTLDIFKFVVGRRHFSKHFLIRYSSIPRAWSVSDQYSSSQR